jgi:hypothetical protein
MVLPLLKNLTDFLSLLLHLIVNITLCRCFPLPPVFKLLLFYFLDAKIRHYFELCNTLHYLFCRNVQYFTLFNFIDGKRHKKKAGTAEAIPAQNTNT